MQKNQFGSSPKINYTTDTYVTIEDFVLPECHHYIRLYFLSLYMTPLHTFLYYESHIELLNLIRSTAH